MVEIELEKTYLVKKLPEGLEKCPHKEIFDIYIPAEVRHPTLRVRRKGNSFEMTKKEPIKGRDSSEQAEHTIKLSEEEFKSLADLKGKKVRKIRYDFPYNGMNAEIAVFKDELEGLALVDIEFSDSKTKDEYEMPDFCLADVTQDEVFAGGMLCGKKYADLEPYLDKFGYEPSV